ncbi:hypothetical protein AVEN_951-1 [Araneus ventricosus]|uniref:Uncharacterized protein n=1 Tax=Araneus ventricosus TaxID=182803 RepID=A0A4Y2CYC7_ARAVE|nr:hypothetical protein AVEN_951-1 [Araneus ventricosus]
MRLPSKPRLGGISSEPKPYRHISSDDFQDGKQPDVCVSLSSALGRPFRIRDKGWKNKVHIPTFFLELKADVYANDPASSQPAAEEKRTIFGCLRSRGGWEGGGDGARRRKIFDFSLSSFLFHNLRQWD